MRIVYKILIMLVVVLIVLCTIVYTKVDSYIEKKATTYIQKISDSKYDLQIEETDFSIHSMTITFNGVKLNSVDSTYIELDSSKYILPNFNASSIVLKNIDLFKLLFGSEAVFNLQLKQPKIDLLVNNQPKNSIRLPRGSNSSWYIKNLDLIDGSFAYQKNSMSLSMNIDLNARDIRSKDIKNSLSKSVEAKFYSINFKEDNTHVGIMCDTLQVMGSIGEIKAQNVRFTTLADKYEIGHILGHETDWFNVSIASIVARQNQFLTFEDTLRFRNLYFDRVNALIFRDKRLKFPNIPDKLLPHEIIEKISLSLLIDTISVSNGDITYQEHAKGSLKAGEISLNQLGLMATNFSTVSPLTKMVMNANALVMGKGLLEVKAKIPLSTEALPYEVSGTIYEQQVINLNPIISHVTGINLVSGVVKKSTFSFTHDAISSKGQLNLAYEGLKLKFINPSKKGTVSQLDDNLMSFAANTFVVKKNNFRNENMRIGEIEFVRDPKKSFLNYWWKSLLSGIKSSTGLTQKK